MAESFPHLKLQREEPVTEKRPGRFRLPKALADPSTQHIEKALRCSASQTNGKIQIYCKRR
jgi:hypothetical protein